MSADAVSPQPPAQLIADRAYTELRERIVTLRLPPGTTLREEALMAELGLGRTPLRDALKRLSLENLVTVEPRRATTVTHVDAADIVHISEVRAELEAQAAELAAMRLDEATRAEGTAILAQLEELERRLDSDALMHLDERIHRLVWRASRNPYLTANARALLHAVAAHLVRRHRPRARARRAGARPGAAAACGARPRRRARAQAHARARARVPARGPGRVQPRLSARVRRCAPRPRARARARAIAVSRILNFCTLPVTVIGNSSTNMHVARHLEVGEAALAELADRRRRRASRPRAAAPTRTAPRRSARRGRR